MIVIVKRNLTRNENSASPPDRHLSFSKQIYLQAFHSFLRDKLVTKGGSGGPRGF